MRVGLILAAALVLASFAAAAQAAPAFPPGAEAKEAQLMTKVGPRTRAWIKQEAARELRGNIVSQQAALQAAGHYGAGQNLSSADIDMLVMMVMMESARDNERDLQRMAEELQQLTAAKQAQRQKLQQAETTANAVRGQQRQALSVRAPAPGIVRSAALDAYLAAEGLPLDSLGDISQQQQLQLQMALDRRTKLMEMISNIMKKISDTGMSVTQNLK